MGKIMWNEMWLDEQTEDQLNGPTVYIPAVQQVVHEGYHILTYGTNIDKSDKTNDFLLSQSTRAHVKYK